MIKNLIILLCCLLISDIYSQELIYDKGASGPAIAFNITNSNDITGYGGGAGYIFNGHHAFAFSYGTVDDDDYKDPIKSYSVCYTGIIHETDHKPKLHFQLAMSLGYTHMTDLTSNIITAGLTLFKRVKADRFIFAPAVDGSYSLSFGGTKTSQNIVQYGGSFSLGLMLGQEKRSVVALIPALAQSKNITVLSFGFGLAINSM
jgi:hypothetical protein